MCFATRATAIRIPHQLKSTTQWNEYATSVCGVPPKHQLPSKDFPPSRRALASLLRRSSTDPQRGIQLSPSDLAAIEAVAVCLEWPLVPAAANENTAANCTPEDTNYVRQNRQLQFVGVLPLVGRPGPGGSWEPVLWHGRSIPWSGNIRHIISRNRAKERHNCFFVRLLQPNLYVGSETRLF